MNDPNEKTRAFKTDILEILLALSDGPLHGYGIVQAVASRSESDTSLAPSLLYRRLHRLLDDGVVEAAGEVSGERGKPRRLYRLSARGHEVLRAEVGRLVTMADSPFLRGVLECPTP